MLRRNPIVFDAPSNLGLRPPAQGVVPGCYKLPWALRDRNLLAAVQARDGGSLVPPRYHSEWRPGEGDRNAETIAAYSGALADRIQHLTSQHQPVIVLGGDCSILIGSMLALKRTGRYGLVFIDAHSDFRHPGNSPEIGAAAGEDLAIVTGRGDHRLINLEGMGPYVQEEDVHIVGVRSNDDYLSEIASTKISVTSSEKLITSRINDISKAVLNTTTTNTSGFWIHLDMDVVDSSEMPAVDSPEADGPSFSLLAELLSKLCASPHWVGLEITIYDPDLDPTGIYAEKIVQLMVQALSRDD